MYNNNGLKIFIDLDGVLCSFTKGLVKELDLKVEGELLTILKSGNTIDSYLKSIGKSIPDNLDYNFWYNLELMPWAHDLVGLCHKISGGAVVFCTSPGKWVEAPRAKIDYIKTHFDSDDFVILRDKEWVSAPNHFLIDDSYYQVKPFRDAGGEAFHWPNEFCIRDFELNVEQVLQDLEFQLNKLIEDNRFGVFYKDTDLLAPYQQ